MPRPDVTDTWKSKQERGSAFLIRFIAWLACRTGRTFTRALLYPIAAYFVLFAPSARRSSRDYLRRVFGREPRLGEVFAHLHCFAATLLDRVFFLSGRFDLFEIDIDGLDDLKGALTDGQGALLLGAHFGSFDAMRAIAHRFENRTLKILIYEGNASTVARVLESIQPDFREQIIPLGPPESLMKVHDEIGRGSMVGILGDRITHGDKSETVTFLGTPAKVAAGPWQLGAILKAPIVVFSAVYDGGNRYKVYLRSLTPDAAAGAYESGQAAAQAYIDIIEEWARRHPYNWFNFYDFWT